MKKITILMMIFAGFFAVSCSSPSGSGSGNGNENGNDNNYDEENTAEFADCKVTFKINGINCTLDYRSSGVYDFNTTSYSNLMIDKDYSGNTEALKYVKKITESKMVVTKGISDNGYLKYYFDSENNNIDKDILKKLFPSDDGKIRITDVKYRFYFTDQYGIKLNENEGVYRQFEKKVPEWYIDNKGANNFSVKDGILKLYVYEGKINDNGDKIVTTGFYDASSEINPKNVSYNCKYFIPHDIWSSKDYYETVESYLYDIDVIYQKDGYRNVWKWRIDLKGLVNAILGYNNNFSTDEDIIFETNNTREDENQDPPVNK